MKKIFLFISLLLATTNLMAEPIGEKRAREIATDFLSQRMTRSTISNLQLEWAGNNINGITRAGNNTDDSLMYIYNSEASKSFVIVGGDTNADFVIAYSLNTTFNMENIADGAKAILNAWCRQIEDARNNNKPINIDTRQSTRTNDKREYETALWGQGEPYNREAFPIDDELSLTGCMATAMAILCYYHKWPDNGVGTTPEYTYIYTYTENGYEYKQEYTVPANELGSTYEYDKMIMSYDSEQRNYTEEQANAVAALMKDMGTSVEMSYHPKGSGAFSNKIDKAFVNYFKYSKSTLLAYANNYSYEDWTNLIRETLRNYGPTYYGGDDPEYGGHAYVVDGYDEGNLFHFNFGWNGSSNGYYAIPGNVFYNNQDALLYLKPDRDGTSQYQDNMVMKYNMKYLLPEYFNENKLTTDSIFIYNNGFTTFNGTIKLVLCDRYGNWKQELFTKDYSEEIGDSAYIPSRSVDIDLASLNLEEGDRLRAYYKGEYSDDWQMAISIDGKGNDEVLVMASPENIAEGLQLYYSKILRLLELKNVHPTKIEIYQHDNNALLLSVQQPASQPYRVEIPEDGGTFRFEFSLGSEPYKLVLKF